MGIKDKWIITVGGGYGDFEFTGTEKEAEDMRYNKAKSEGAPAIKHRVPTMAFDKEAMGVNHKRKNKNG